MAECMVQSTRRYHILWSYVSFLIVVPFAVPAVLPMYLALKPNDPERPLEYEAPQNSFALKLPVLYHCWLLIEQFAYRSRDQALWIVLLMFIVATFSECTMLTIEVEGLQWKEASVPPIEGAFKALYRQCLTPSYPEIPTTTFWHYAIPCSLVSTTLLRRAYSFFYFSIPRGIHMQTPYVLICATIGILILTSVELMKKTILFETYLLLLIITSPIIYGGLELRINRFCSLPATIFATNSNPLRETIRHKEVFFMNIVAFACCLMMSENIVNLLDAMNYSGVEMSFPIFFILGFVSQYATGFLGFKPSISMFTLTFQLSICKLASFFALGMLGSHFSIPYMRYIALYMQWTSLFYLYGLLRVLDLRQLILFDNTIAKSYQWMLLSSRLLGCLTGFLIQRRLYHNNFENPRRVSDAMVVTFDFVGAIYVNLWSTVLVMALLFASIMKHGEWTYNAITKSLHGPLISSFYFNIDSPDLTYIPSFAPFNYAFDMFKSAILLDEIGFLSKRDAETTLKLLKPRLKNENMGTLATLSEGGKFLSDMKNQGFFEYFYVLCRNTPKCAPDIVSKPEASDPDSTDLLRFFHSYVCDSHGSENVNVLREGM